MPTKGNGHNGHGGDEITKRTRPVMNIENRPLVEVLYHSADLYETSAIRIADALRDVAKAIQLSAERTDQVTQERIARFADEHADAIRPVGVHIREAGL